MNKKLKYSTIHLMNKKNTQVFANDPNNSFRKDMYTQWSDL